MYRQHPSWIAARELVASGRIGRLQAVDSWFSYFNDDPANIRNIAATGGGALYDIGCYSREPVADAVRLRARPACGPRITRDARLGVDVTTSGILGVRERRGDRSRARTRAETDQRVRHLRHGGRISIEIPFNIPPDRPDAGLRDGGRRSARRARDRDAQLRRRRPVRVRGGALRGRGPRRRPLPVAARGRRRQPAGDRGDLRRGRLSAARSRPIARMAYHPGASGCQPPAIRRRRDVTEEHAAPPSPGTARPGWAGVPCDPTGDRRRPVARVPGGGARRAVAP